METPAPSPHSHVTRRRILLWTGVGAMSGIAGYLGWPDRGTALAPQDRKTSGTRATASEAQTTEATQTPDPASAPAAPMTREAFLPHVGSAFQLDSGSIATLLNVGAAQQTGDSTSYFISFSLLFSLPAGSPPESRIYKVTHPEMGVQELFISSVGLSEKLIHLEAICSQRV